MKWLKIICSAKMLGKADKTIQAQKSQFATTYRCYFGKITSALGLAGDQGMAYGDGWRGIACGVQGTGSRTETGVCIQILNSGLFQQELRSLAVGHGMGSWRREKCGYVT